ncbi:hypothetical protein ELG88_17980 [Rhizobium leguminosarum]|uniref:hypothetical protein n=1 Tax=Rhizobium leguminosarum TaxID=384 RepID=UPI0010325078|nr:hypothetical protein [Rhizobium leguminosarum]TBF36976.1 hypothetical protein ELG88_17980 [Rhizobium leguminosarum]
MEHESPADTDSASEAAMRQAYRLIDDQVAQLVEAKKNIDLKLAHALEARESLRKFLSGNRVESRPHSDESVTELNLKTKKQFRKGSQTGEVVARSKRILREIGRPMDRAELLLHITAGGYDITTADPSRFIGRTLWESEDFIHIPKKGYWLAGVAEPAIPHE